MIKSDSGAHDLPGSGINSHAACFMQTYPDCAQCHELY